MSVVQGDNELEKALQLDSQYPTYQEWFNVPSIATLGLGDDDKKSIYFCGNSLGLMPKSTRKAVNDELDAWSDRAVESHFRHRGVPEGKTSWVDIDLPVVPLLAPVVGAKENEVGIMATLTMNLNALLTVFFKPEGAKTKILFEKSAFPSDFYSIYSFLKLKGLDPDQNMIQLSPRHGEYTLRTEDILKLIEENCNELALVLFPGIQYYTGQLFDIEQITKYAKLKGCTVGWDLAHLVGNVPLKLHDWDVDFAVWCSYKYLNSGPGAIGGYFINEKYTHLDTPRLAGWWGNNSLVRFQMKEKFEPIESALGFRQSNPSVLDVVALHNSLKIFDKVGGVDTLRLKSVEMTNYLESLLVKSPYYIDQEKSFDDVTTPCFTIITGKSRGSQLSVLFLPHHDDPAQNVMELVNSNLNKRHLIICDERRPDVIRLLPVSLYNSFEECYKVVHYLNEAFSELI